MDPLKLSKLRSNGHLTETVCITHDSITQTQSQVDSYCGRPWPAAYININVNTHQIQVLTEPLCRAQAIFYSLPNNEWGTKYRGLTSSRS